MTQASLFPSDTAPELEGLDPEQRAAVEHDQGPLLIVAGAGTGKTTVIARRIAHLIAVGRARPAEILSLTFNEKAAAEMQERVDVLVPYGYADTHISTFHSFGEEVLSSFGIEIGIAPGFSVLDQTAQALFLAEHIEALGLKRYAPLSDPTRYVRELARFFNRLKDYPIATERLRELAEGAVAASGEDMAERDRGERYAELAAAAGRYDRLLWKQGFVDFGDLLALPLRLFEESPAAVRFFQERFRYILVDEFQDTNPVQFDIVRRLTALHRNLVVVGDDDQSIYRFRGAHLQNILKFHEFFPDARSIVLTRNYRSSREILKAARRLILVNRERLETRLDISKELHAERSGPAPRMKELPTEAEEAAWVAGEIRAAVESGTRRCRDFAILVRSNKNAEPFLRALDEQGVPYYFSGSRGLFQRPEIKELVAVLYALSQDTREEYLYLLAQSAYAVPGEDLNLLVHALSTNPVTLRALMERAVRGSGTVAISEEGRGRVAAMLEDLGALRTTARDHGTGEVLRAYLDRRGILKRLRTPTHFEDEIKARNIVKFFKLVQTFGTVAVVDRVPLFLRHLAMVMEHGEDPAVAEIGEESDVVQVLTIHRAKGLEFPVVYLVQAASDLFPTRNFRRGIEVPVELAPGERQSSELHKEEERRLCYVAFTRAKDELVATHALDYGGKMLRRRSEFLSEAFDLGKPAPARKKRRLLEELDSDPATARGLPPLGRPATREPILLSHNRIADYDTCPLKYHFIHVLAIDPILTRDHRVNFGNAIHQAVAFALERHRLEQSPTFEQVLEVFRSNWRNEGYRSEDHARRRFDQGVEALRAFLEREVLGQAPPTEVERSFRFKLGDVIVSGRMDRVDEGPDGVVITDYKTSELDEEEKADSSARENLQLSIYALAHKMRTGRAPERLELKYVLSGATGTSTRSEEKLERTRDRILAIAESVRSGDFRAQPSEHNCSICACRPICGESAV
ncbi:MAG TPA: ATP-dependent DNA helicase [Candidatus Eisenbacteria bacterium]|nr:ATP-dependent DNA helicase [Candidatus Eisenbacteria bacterium]